MHLNTLSQTEQTVLKRVQSAGGTLALALLDDCEAELELLKTLGLVRLLHHTTQGEIVGLTTAGRNLLDPSLAEPAANATETVTPAPANGVNRDERSLMVLRQIASGNGIDPARVDGRSVRKLERLGWVERRRKLLYVTDEGKAQLEGKAAPAQVKAAPKPHTPPHPNGNGVSPTPAPVEIEVAVEAETPSEAADLLTRVAERMAEEVEHGIQAVLEHVEDAVLYVTHGVGGHPVAPRQFAEAATAKGEALLLPGCNCSNEPPDCFNREFLLKIMAANPQIRTAYDALREAERLIAELSPGQD
jgi:DNA-binding MarR family transcriptional regulator